MTPNGDTFLDNVSSQFLKTKVISKGKVAGTPGQKGKIATIDLEARNGRIEDILRLFTTEGRGHRWPAMCALKEEPSCLPVPERFLKKIELTGDFGISDSSFTRSSTQEKVDQLSQNALTEEREHAKSKDGKRETAPEVPPPVVSISEAMLCSKYGTATSSNLSFYIPGAHAQMHGTYNLISEKIDLHGALKMDSIFLTPRMARKR